ncbi:MAG: M24 family metallopeptidase [Vicinamibacteria bacterium]
MDRRGFLQIAAGATALSFVPPRESPAAEEPTVPDAVKSLKNRLDGVVPITDEERKGRIANAQRLMKDSGLSSVFVESGSSLFYYTGVRWGRSERMFAMVIPAEGEPSWVCPAFEEERARELIRFGDDIRTWEEHESPYRLVAQILTDRGARTGKMGIEETTRFFFVDGIATENPGLEISSGDPVTVGCRIAKSKTELLLMKRANEITVEAYHAAVKSLKEGMTHREVSRIISAAFAAMGVEGGAGVQFGEFSAFPHGSSKPQKLQEGQIVMMDGGCKVEGYSSDVTRTVVFGKPTDRQRQIWDLEKKAQDAARDAVRPGVPCEAIDAAARKVVTDAGFGPDYEHFTHRVGHGIGLDGHEWTYLVRGNGTPLAPGMCFSNEPGIYLYGEFGVRLEDCFHVTESGGELFTRQSPSIDDPFGTAA